MEPRAEGDALFLSQRIPYPPNKGDKIRSWHFFRHVAETHRMHLGCFIDDPADWADANAVRKLCASACIRPLAPRRAKLRSLAGLATREALTLPYFRSRALHDWVAETVRRHAPALIFVFYSAMAQYVLDLPRGTARLVLDMVDMDSQKWRQYAARKRWPGNLVYRREARLLHGFERRAALHFDASLFVSRAELELFRRLTPEAADRADFVGNGVDLAYFDPALPTLNPYPPEARPVVFTGAMDYWPNVDAVTWFADRVWPRVHAADPKRLFAIVGANPTPAVRALGQRPGILVTGRVADVRPYLAHAVLAVAPLRVAQGVQNKVLEAMSMARPVVATPQAVEGIDAEPGREVVLAEAEVEFASRVSDFFARPQTNSAGRAFVERNHSWTGTLRKLSAVCAATTRAAAATAPAASKREVATGV